MIDHPSARPIIVRRIPETILLRCINIVLPVKLQKLTYTFFRLIQHRHVSVALKRFFKLKRRFLKDKSKGEDSQGHD
jgi:hypothetical protein